MANTEARIDVVVKGGSKLERLIKDVSRLESVVDRINVTPLDINVGRAESTFNAALQQLTKARKEVGNAQKAYNEYDKTVKKLEKSWLAAEQASLRAAESEKKSAKERADAVVKRLQAEEKFKKGQKEQARLKKTLEKKEQDFAQSLKYKEEAKNLAKIVSALSDLSGEYLKLGRFQTRTPVTGKVAATQTRGTIAQLNAQAEALSLVAANSEIATRQFRQFTIASEVASQGISSARQEQFRALAMGLTAPARGEGLLVASKVGSKKELAGARALIGEVVASYGGIVKSEAALSSYINQLRSLQSIVPFDTSEWGLLETSINEVNAELEQLQARYAGLRGQSSDIAQAMAAGIAQPQGEAMLLPQFSVKSAAEKARYERDLANKQDAQIDKLIALQNKLEGEYLDQNEAIEIRNKFEKISSDTAEGLIDSARRQTVELKRQINTIKDRNKALQDETKAAVSLGQQKLKEEAKTGVTTEKVDNARKKLESAEERIETSAQKELINEVQKKNLLLKLDEARLEIDQKRLTVAQTIVAETDRLRRLEEVGNRASAVRSRAGIADPVEGPLELRQKYATDLNKEYQKQLDLLSKIDDSGLESARKEDLRVQAAQALEALMENRLEIAQGITKEIDRQFKLEQKQVKPSETAVNRIIRGGETLPIDARRRVTNTLASGAIAEQSLINLQNKGVDVTEQLISLQKTLNDAKRDDFQISERTLGNLQEQVTLAGKRVTLENRRLAGKRGGGGTDDSSVTSFSAALTPAEARKQIDQIYKDFNKAVAGNDSTRIGGSIAEGVVDGASDSSEINSGAKTFAQRLIAAFRSALRIKSPSGEARDKIGEPVGQGVIEGAVDAITRAKFSEAIAKAATIDLRNKIKNQLRLEFEAAFQATKRMLPPGMVASPAGGGLGIGTENVLRMRDAARKPSEADRLLASGGYAFEQVSGQEFVIEDFLKAIRSATSVFNQYFNANSVLPVATRELAAAMNRVSAQLSLPSAPGGVAALPSSEMMTRQRFAEAAAKAQEEDLRLAVEARMRELASAPLALPPAGGSSASARSRESLVGISAMQAPSIGLEAKAEQSAQELVTAAQDVFPEFSKKFRKNANSLIPSAAATAAGKSIGEIGDYARRIQHPTSGTRGLESAVGFQQGQRAPYVPPPGFGVGIPSLEQEVAGKVRRLFERIGTSIESIRIPSLGGFGGFGGRGGGGGGGRGGAGGTAGGGDDAGDGGKRRNRGWIDDLRDDIQEAFRGGDLPAITKATSNQLEELAQSLERVRRTADPAGDAFRRANRGLRAVAAEQERRDPGADFLTRRLGARRGRAVGEGVIGGAFPLLFGQGVGASVGGGAGGFFGSLIGGNLGFGLSLLGTALGDVFDQLQMKAAAIGNAIQNATSNMEALRASGVNVTAELEAQVRLLNRYGASEAAQSAVEEAVFRQTGDIGGQGTRLAAGSANELQKAFEGMSAAAATAVGIIGAPFMQAITAAFRGVQAILFAFNSIVTAVTSIINAIPGMEALGDALYEASLRGTAEYEKRQNELEKETENLGRLLQEQQKYNSELQAASGLRSNELKVAKMLIDYRQKERQSVEAILQKQEELGAGRTVEERKRIETQLNAFRELEYEKLREFALRNEKEIFDAQEDNVKKIQELNESNAKSYRDMRLQIERQIEDERIAAARRIEDAELKGARAVLDFKEKGLQIIQNQRREQIELASAIRGLEAQFSANPSREGLAAQLSAAVDQYKNGLAEADENRKLAEEKIQLDAREAALAIERFKQDNARRVARINEESVRKIAEINNRIDKQRSESYKYAYDLTIQRLIAQEQSAANQLEQRKAGNEALLSSPFITPDYKIAIEQEIRSIDAQLTAVETGIQRLRRLQGQLPATPQLQNVGSLPVMTSQASEVSAAETRVNSLIQAGKERLLQLEQQNTKEGAAARLARQALQIIDSQGNAQTQITESLNKRIEDARRYKQLLASGINPELAKQVATIEGASAKISDVIEMTIKQLEALDGSKFKELIEALQGIQQDQPTIVSEQIDKTKKALELEKPTLAEGISAEINQLEKDLDPITVATNSIINGANAIGTAFGQAFTDVASGAKSTEQALADTFESIGKAFLGMAAEIIAKQLAMIALQTILKALGVISGGFSFAGGSAEAGLGAANQMGGVGPLNAGMFGFRANGGPVNANQPYIVGERGPELFVPLQQGNITSNEELEAQIAEARDVLNDGSAIDVSAADEQATPISTDSYALTQAAQGKEPAGVTAKDLAYVLQDSRGAIEDIKRITREREAIAASMPQSASQDVQRLLSSPDVATAIRETLGGSAGAAADQAANGDGDMGGVAQTEAESFRALADARSALVDAAQASVVGDAGDGASDASQNVLSNADRRAASGSNKAPEELKYILRDSRGAIDSIMRVVKERESLASTSSTSANSESLLSKEIATIREASVGASATDQASTVPNDLSSQQIEVNAVSAARDALSERVIGGDGSESGTRDGIVTNSRELIEKIAAGGNPFDSNRSAIASNNSGIERIETIEKIAAGDNPFDSSRSAIASGNSAAMQDKAAGINTSSTTERIDTKESSALTEAKETTNGMMALSQTRQMLNSVSSVNKERSVEKAIEATVSGSVKPLDVRYESQVINNVEYVTAEQHRKGIAEAAERGKNMAFQVMQNSVTTRKRLGL